MHAEMDDRQPSSCSVNKSIAIGYVSLQVSYVFLKASVEE